ncbi:MAG: hypothetical protein GQ570_00265 [Helicobacteraceae bacterium]|nr:hypothetical protein [Helicobacteraceae bacterium]
MRGENFVSYLTVQGFFIGVVFALLKSEGPDSLFLYTFLITGFFYMFAHVAVAFYFRTVLLKPIDFPKDEYEHHLDALMGEIVKRENYVDEVQGANKFAKEIKKEQNSQMEKILVADKASS